MTDQEMLTLDNLSDGAVKELFQTELDKVILNIQDPNTDATKAREITLKFKVIPNETRDKASIEVYPSSKLAPARAIGVTAFIGMSNGAGVAAEYRRPQQLDMLPQTPANVTIMSARVGGQREEKE